MLWQPQPLQRTGRLKPHGRRAQWNTPANRSILCGAWLFNEGSSQVTDYCLGHAGTVSGTTAYTGGLFGGQAFSFDGASYVNVPTTTFLESGAFGVVCWFKLDTAVGFGDYYPLVTKRAAGGPTGFYLRVIESAGANKLSISVNSTTVTGATSLSAGTWYQAGATFNNTGGELKLFLDGVLDNSTTGATYTVSTNDLRFGTDDGAANFLEGAIDHILLFRGGQVLAPEQFYLLYNRPFLYFPAPFVLAGLDPIGEEVLMTSRIMTSTP